MTRRQRPWVAVIVLVALNAVTAYVAVHYFLLSQSVKCAPVP